MEEMERVWRMVDKDGGGGWRRIRRLEEDGVEWKRWRGYGG
jgi:hypothetical protein